MKSLKLFIFFLCISTFSFAQTRVDIGEIYGAQLKKTIHTSKKKVYRIDTKALFSAPKSEDNYTEVRMTLFNHDFDIRLIGYFFRLGRVLAVWNS